VYPADRTVTIAALSDLHVREGEESAWAAIVRNVPAEADVLIIAGDMTENGWLGEAEASAAMLAEVSVPMVAVLGNHDLRGLRRKAFREVFERAGVQILVDDPIVVPTRSGVDLGIAGVAGSGGGFTVLAEDGPIPARALRSMALRMRREALKLDEALAELKTPIRIAVSHFAPTETTLGAEPSSKWWMLGNRDLGRVADRHGVDLFLHGHAHLGSPVGETEGGIPVRNVALPVNGDVVVITLPVPEMALPR